MKKLNEIFSISGNGIFNYISLIKPNDENLWIDEHKDEMDIDYLSRSGEKTISPLVVNFLENEELTVEKAKKLAKIIYFHYRAQWGKNHSTLELDYNPVENYSTERSGSSYGGNSSSNNGSTSITDDTTNNTFGFNDDTARPADSTSNRGTNISSDTRSGTFTENSSNNTHGFVGYYGRTRQSLIEQERKVNNWDFFEDIYKDIDKLLTLGIYM